MTKTRSVGYLLNNANDGLAKIIQRGKQLQKLTTALKNMVDAPLCDHIYVANIREDKLIVGTDSAIWHTRIKYLGPVILEQMQQLHGLEKLQGIEFRIQPLAPQPANQPNSKLTQSDMPSAAIGKSAGDLRSNDLHQAMQHNKKERDKTENDG